jgi:hypothetical protein
MTLEKIVDLNDFTLIFTEDKDRLCEMLQISRSVTQAKKEIMKYVRQIYKGEMNYFDNNPFLLSIIEQKPNSPENPPVLRGSRNVDHDTSVLQIGVGCYEKYYVLTFQYIKEGGQKNDK